MKKSARAYGSTTAWNAASDSCISSAGVGLTLLAGSMLTLPAAPRKSPMTAMSGLNTFDAPAAAVLVLDGGSAASDTGADEGAAGDAD